MTQGSPGSRMHGTVGRARTCPFHSVQTLREGSMRVFRGFLKGAGLLEGAGLEGGALTAPRTTSPSRWLAFLSSYLRRVLFYTNPQVECLHQLSEVDAQIIPT